MWKARVLTRYKILDNDAVLLLGTKYYQANNNQRQGPGTNASNADFNFAEEEFPNFQRQVEFDFPNLNLAFFGENIFKITERFSLPLAFDSKYIKTESDGFFRNIVLDLAGNALLNEALPDNRTFERNFLLLGVGATYKASKFAELYANFSQNYRSVTFNDIRLVNPTFQIDPNISDEDGFTTRHWNTWTL